ncbi:MAG: SocA family protein [Magnetococcales bacterium]|nr:SocA family protein [Magnetococcales bacterium]
MPESKPSRNPKENLTLLIAMLIEKRQVNRTSLNKQLFFCDLLHFQNFKKSLSRASYRKLDFGPVPDNISEVREFMIQSDLITENMVANGPYYEYLYEANSDKIDYKKAEKLLGEKESRLVRAVASGLSDISASELSRITHEHEPWKSGQWFEELELESGIQDKDLMNWLNARVKYHPHETQLN